jgi:hypothetical protein
MDSGTGSGAAAGAASGSIGGDMTEMTFVGEVFRQTARTKDGTKQPVTLTLLLYMSSTTDSIPDHKQTRR